MIQDIEIKLSLIELNELIHSMQCVEPCECDDAHYELLEKLIEKFKEFK